MLEVTANSLMATTRYLLLTSYPLKISQSKIKNSRISVARNRGATSKIFSFLSKI